MKQLFIAWQDPSSRKWIPVGKLSKVRSGYTFEYTRGAKESDRFVPFGRMKELHDTYYSEKIFPLFANRILAKSRPEYGDYLRWLGFEGQEVTDLELLARSG